MRKFNFEKMLEMFEEFDFENTFLLYFFMYLFLFYVGILRLTTDLNRKYRTRSYNRSRPTEVFMQKGILKIGSKFFRRTSMAKCNFNKVALQLYWNHTLAWVFSWKFAAYFRNIFSQEQLWRDAFDITS